MKKGTIIAICAFLVALVGVMVALAAYLKRNGSCCNDLDDDIYDDLSDVDYFPDPLEDEPPVEPGPDVVPENDLTQE